MLLGFNCATGMNYDLKTDIRLAKHAGFELLEIIGAAKLNKCLESNSAWSLKQLFGEAGIKLEILWGEVLSYRLTDAIIE